MRVTLSVTVSVNERHTQDGGQLPRLNPALGDGAVGGALRPLRSGVGAVVALRPRDRTRAVSSSRAALAA